MSDTPNDPLKGYVAVSESFLYEMLCIFGALAGEVGNPKADLAKMVKNNFVEITALNEFMAGAVTEGRVGV